MVFVLEALVVDKPLSVLPAAPELGGIPLRDNDVTEYPSKRARRQMVCPKKPVPPKTSNFPFLSDDDDDDDDWDDVELDDIIHADTVVDDVDKESATRIIMTHAVVIDEGRTILLALLDSCCVVMLVKLRNETKRRCYRCMMWTDEKFLNVWASQRGMQYNHVMMKAYIGVR